MLPFDEFFDVQAILNHFYSVRQFGEFFKNTHQITAHYSHWWSFQHLQVSINEMLMRKDINGKTPNDYACQWTFRSGEINLVESGYWSGY